MMNFGTCSQCTAPAVILQNPDAETPLPVPLCKAHFLALLSDRRRRADAAARSVA